MPPSAPSIATPLVVVHLQVEEELHLGFVVAPEAICQLALDGRKEARDHEARRVPALVQFGARVQAGATARRPDQADDGGDVDERGATPVHRDV